MFSGLISYCYDQQSCETMSKSSKSIALRMKVHCKDCGVELKKQLKEVNGVDSVDIDHKLGKVVISGKVDPEKVLRKLEKRGREAELWPCEKLKVNDPPSGSNIVEVKLFDNPRLHNVEVKLTFQGQSTSNNTGITKSKVLPHGGGGRLCSASSSCCGCNHGNTRFGSCYANNRNNYCYHNVPATQPEMLPHGGGLCFASSSCCGGHGGNYTHSGSYCADNRNNYSCHCLRPLPMGYIPHPLMMQPPWSGDRTIPSAPPLPSDYFQPPASPPSYLSVRPSYYSVLSDENTNRCIIQ
ncbi:putative protein isoform X2 [Capsicum galapagoense]